MYSLGSIKETFINSRLQLYERNLKYQTQQKRQEHQTPVALYLGIDASEASIAYQMIIVCQKYGRRHRQDQEGCSSFHLDLHRPMQHRCQHQGAYLRLL